MKSIRQQAFQGWGVFSLTLYICIEDVMTCHTSMLYHYIPIFRTFHEDDVMQDRVHSFNPLNLKFFFHPSIPYTVIEEISRLAELKLAKANMPNHN